MSPGNGLNWGVLNIKANGIQTPSEDSSVSLASIKVDCVWTTESTKVWDNHLSKALALPIHSFTLLLVVSLPLLPFHLCPSPSLPSLLLFTSTFFLVCVESSPWLGTVLGARDSGSAGHLVLPSWWSISDVNKGTPIFTCWSHHSFLLPEHRARPHFPGSLVVRCSCVTWLSSGQWNVDRSDVCYLQTPTTPHMLSLSPHTQPYDRGPTGGRQGPRR